MKLPKKQSNHEKILLRISKELLTRISKISKKSGHTISETIRILLEYGADKFE